MLRRTPFTILGVSLCAVVLLPAVLLTGCGARTTGAVPTASTPATTVTLPVGTPGKESTPVTGVTIATDKSVYAPTDTIRATAANHLGTSIFATSGKANCGIFEVQVKTTQGWQVASIAPCVPVRASEPVQIAPGATLAASITATTNAGAFPAGTYRLALSFSSFTVPPPRAQASHDGRPLGARGTISAAHGAIRAASPLTTVYSAPFVVR